MNRSLLHVTATMLLAAALSAAVAAQGRPNPAVGFALGSPDVAVEPAGDSQTMPAKLYVAMAQSLAREADPDYGIDSRGRGANSRHGFELAFSPEGVRVVGVDGDLILRLTRVGRGDGEPVQRTMPRIEGAWVEYDRGPGLEEWFVNAPRGVEQGWTFSERPAGVGPLTLEIDTGWELEEIHTGQFAGPGIVYHGLVAFDADGRVLPSLWTREGTRLRIEVDDAAAEYPVVIDPWVQQAKLTADDGDPSDLFGNSVAVSDDSALVGAWQATVDGNEDQGAAYIFTRSGEGWIQQAKLTADDGGDFDYFGTSVALSGDIALVGTIQTVDGNGAQGSAYVFTRVGDAWTQQAKLTADDGAALDFFGNAVALTNGTALVGAERADVDGWTDRGAAYVFVRSGEAWIQQAKLIASDSEFCCFFGSSVAMVSDTAVIGADGALAAYVFTRSDGTWSEQAKLVAADGDPGSAFGRSVAIAGDTALVGAPGIGSASTYVFSRSGNVWSQQAKLTPADGAVDGFFGGSVALVGDTALIGAPETTVGDNSFQGAAYVFTRSGSAWTQKTRIIASDGEADDFFGATVALSDGTGVIGTPGAAYVGEKTDRGAAYVYLPPLFPVGLGVDFPSIVSDGNGVFEPGEQVAVAPSWRNNESKSIALSGTVIGFTGPEGADYSLLDGDADYGLVEAGEIASCLNGGDCYQMSLNTPAERPATHWDATFVETLSDLASTTQSWALHIGDSFTDVDQSHLFYPWIETLLHQGVTSGCAASAYCPADPNTRGQMSVFLLKAAVGSEYLPPGCVEGAEKFEDVPFDSPFCRWIEELARRGVTTGCDGGNYCPEQSVTRAQMAVFLLKALEGQEYAPPPCSEMFDDVACPSLFANWIEDLVAREITAGCGGGNYCPASLVSRSQMAVFLAKTFGLKLYGR